MELVNWKQKGFSGREYIVSTGGKPIGRLKFKGWSSYDAAYTSEEMDLNFTTKGWFQQEITIRYNGEEIGKAEASVFGKTYISLISGERYKLESKTFSQTKTLIDEEGKPVIHFDQQGVSGTKGNIRIADTMPEMTKMAMIGISLYLKATTDSQTAILIAVFTPIFLNLIR